jgi:GNAT superfamily N-acetyltransferase
VRAAVIADVPALARLRYEFRAALDPTAETEAAFVARCVDWMAVRLEAGTWRAWVAEEAPGGAIVGTVWLHLIEKLPNPVLEPERHGYISSLYVRPAARGAGTGSTLLRACIDACAREGVDAILLWPTPASRGLYERHGFAVRDDLLERRLVAPPDHPGGM